MIRLRTSKAKNKKAVNTKISFFNSEKIKCPVCGEDFQREELLTGGGRLNAENLTDELHRLYRPTEKFGNIYPLIYSIWTCPKCYYSAFREDFEKPKQFVLENLRSKAYQEERKANIELIFEDLNFNGYRRLEEGVAVYIAGIYTYEHFTSNMAPMLKQGICAIRAAWLACHLHYEKPEENYDYLARILYRKAAFFYNQAIVLNDSVEQPLVSSSIINFGPDNDHNFGLDGAIYLASMLQYKYGQRSDQKLRIKRLNEAKIMIARLVGTGKSSANKPVAILNPGRELYSNIVKEVKQVGYWS